MNETLVSAPSKAFPKNEPPGAGKNGVTSPAPEGARLSRDAFLTPPVETRIMPFWFWNARMEPPLIERQIAEMARAGAGGFFIHPRQGLDVPYLSEKWFSLVRCAVGAAERAGLHVWLYDEYPYPSGMAGGQLTANHPEFKARALERVFRDTKNGRLLSAQFDLARVASALACPLKGGAPQWDGALDVRPCFGSVLTRNVFWRWELNGCPYNDKRFMADGGRLVFEWTPPDTRDWRVFFAFEREQDGFKYFDCYFDPLREGAAAAFLRLTHERYAAAVGRHFGKTIKGIFTDETEPPEWSPEIENKLMDDFALDAALLLPALHDDTHPRAAAFRYRFRQCALQLFQERWETPLAAWCRAHGLVWGAEKPTWRPAQFLAFGEPSTDAGHRRAGDTPEPLPAMLRANSRAALAAAEQSGAGIVRCECFHNMGWGATLQDQKWQFDWLAAQGVNRFTPHAFFAGIHGLRKHDAPPSFFLGTPAWKHYRLLADYTARLSLALGSGADASQIAVLHPTETLWIGGKNARRARREYEWLMNSLMASHRGFHPVDAQALASAQTGDGALIAGRATYRVVLVPPLAAADHDTVAAIERALQAGAPVLMAKPLADENLDGHSTAALFNRAGIVPVTARRDWEKLLEKHLPPEFLVTRAGGRNAPDIWAAWRKAGGGQCILFLANTGAKKTRFKIFPDRRFAWSEWSLAQGAAAPCRQDGAGGFDFEMPPWGSLLLVGDLSVQSGQPGQSGQFRQSGQPVRPAFILPLSGEWEIRPLGPNALRLNRWLVSLDEKGARPRETEARPLTYFDNASGQWKHTLGAPFSGKPLRYLRTVHCRFVPDDLALVIEDDAISGAWSLEINGHPVSAKKMLPVRELEACAMPARACRVARYFRKGKNTIVLRITGAPETGGLVTPLHLRGSFAVGVEKSGGVKQREAKQGEAKQRNDTVRVLDRPATHAAFSDPAAAGFPHYSGVMSYRRRVVFPKLRAGDTIALPDAGMGDIVELTLAGIELGACAWSPHRWTLPRNLQGETEVELRVTNTLLPYLEGQQWDTANHQPRDV